MLPIESSYHIRSPSDEPRYNGTFPVHDHAGRDGNCFRLNVRIKARILFEKRMHHAPRAHRLRFHGAILTQQDVQ